MCNESQMNKASAVLFFFLLSCVALLKKALYSNLMFGCKKEKVVETVEMMTD